MKSRARRPRQFRAAGEWSPRVLWRRARWKIHWKLRPGKPFVAQGRWVGLTLLLPKSGSAAAAYLGTFDDDVARWITELLCPEMSVIDVGAHVGVYSLVAARLLGATGVLHAIDPQRTMLMLLARNAELNRLNNVTTHCLALGDSDGQTGLHVMPSLGAFTTTADDADAVPVPIQTMETFARSVQLSELGLVKVDAAGNEFAILRGAQPLLERGEIHSLICKLYHPDVVKERFGTVGGPRAIVQLLRGHGYQVVLPDDRAADDETLNAAFTDDTYCIALLATKPGAVLPSDTA